MTLAFYVENASLVFVDGLFPEADFVIHINEIDTSTEVTGGLYWCKIHAKITNGEAIV